MGQRKRVGGSRYALSIRSGMFENRSLQWTGVPLLPQEREKTAVDADCVWTKNESSRAVGYPGIREKSAWPTSNNHDRREGCCTARRWRELTEGGRP